jgi:hypothetical protein
MAQSSGGRSKKRIVVTPSQVAAAKLKIEMARASGRTVDAATQAIANAKSSASSGKA